MNDQLPGSLRIYGTSAASDGGTVVLLAIDEAGRKYEVMLVQHAFLEGAALRRNIPGRLYFDNRLIPVRSSAEASLLKLLQSSTLESGKQSDQALRASFARSLQDTRQEIVDFVSSNEYVSLAAQIDQIRARRR